MNYILGVDLGTRQDYSALVLARRAERIQERTALPGTWQAETERPMLYSVYEIGLIERFPLGVAYGEVIEAIRWVTELPFLFRQNLTTVVDATGVGYPVLQQMQNAGIASIGVTITGGTSTGENDIGYTVPKRDLVSAMQIVYQTDRIRVSGKLKLTKVFNEELKSFRRKETASRKETFEGEAGEHDDIVLAASLAIWYGERAFGFTTEAPTDDTEAYNPLRPVKQ